MLSASITLYPREPQGEISPFLHGQCLEPTGDSISSGLWVGENDEIPHQNGIRKDVFEALAQLEPPVLRWPEASNWRDGIGPREGRPRRVFPRGASDEISSNALGSHEFLRLCQGIGAQAWLSVDGASAPPRDLAQWAEYCNFPSGTTLSDARGHNGDPAPFGVRFWGIGDEIGPFTPETYAAKYRQFESAFPRFAGQNPFLIGVGPDGNHAESARWTRQLLQKLGEWQAPRLDGLDAHFTISNAQNSFGSATAFTLDEYYGMLSQSLSAEKFIDEQRTLLDASPVGRDAKLILGRWGIRHPHDEARPHWQPNTLRDAICAAMSLDLFHRKSKMLWMANLSQGINAGQALLHTFDDVTVKTPTFHVFDLYKRHRGGQLVHADFESGEAGGLPRLSGSASYQNGVVTLSVVNSGASSPVEATVALPGSNIEIVAAKELSGASLATQNTSEAPEALLPREIAPKFEPASSQSDFIHTFAPASVTVFLIKLAS